MMPEDGWNPGAAKISLLLPAGDKKKVDNDNCQEMAVQQIKNQLTMTIVK